MKNPKFTICLLLIAYCLLLVVSPVLANSHLQFEPEVINLSDTPDPYGLGKTADAAKLQTGDDLPTLIGRIIQSGLGLLGIIFFLFMVYGGFIWMKARGNEKEVERAKNILTDSIIGIIIVAAAYAITSFVIRALTQ